MGRTAGAKNKKSCYKCGQSGLKMAGHAGDWHMVDYDSGQRHYCAGKPEVVESKPEAIPYIPETVIPTNETIYEPKYQPSGNGTFDHFAKTVETLEEISLETVKTVRRITTASVQESINQSVHMAQEAVKSMLPVEHRITFPNQPERQPIKGRPHFTMERVLFWLTQRESVYCVGPAGSGKTNGASMAAEILGLRYTEESMSIMTSKHDLVGYKSPDGKMVNGLFNDFFENGGVVALDEMDAASAEVMVSINTVLGNGHATFPDGRTVERHPDFVVVACGNTWGRGSNSGYIRQELDVASLDRFQNVIWDYDEDAEFDWAGTDQRQWVEWVQALRHKASELEMRVVISPRASIKGAKALRAGGRIDWIIEDTISNKMSGDNWDKLINAVGTYMGRD